MRKLKSIVNVHNLIGKGLFACAIGILGFMLGGPLLASAGSVQDCVQNL